MPFIQRNSTYIKSYYQRILWMAIAVHAFYLMVSFWIGMPWFTVFNSGSILLCIFLQGAVRKGRCRIVLLLLHADIYSFAVCSTLLLGWKCGFQILLFCMATFVHFFSDRYKYTPYMFNAAETLLLVALRIYTAVTFEPLAIPLPVATQEILYLLNICITFAVLSSISFIGNGFTELARKELEEQNRSLSELANHDPLTGLLNRRSMQKEVERVLQFSQSQTAPFCIILCDIDDFKKVNDRYGHKCGDLVLQHTAKTLCACLRNGDHVCRWGGEEFLVLLSNTQEESALKTMERLRKNVAKSTVVYAGQEVHITMTFGLCEACEDVTAEELLRNADRLMYQGKKNGKNCVVHQSFTDL